MEFTHSLKPPADPTQKVDCDFQDLICLGCGKVLLHLAAAKIADVKTRFRAKCGVCGDHSKIAELNGKPYLDYPPGFRPDYEQSKFTEDLNEIMVVPQ